MKKRAMKLWGILKRVGEANLNLDHYWFLPKPVVLPLEKQDMEIREEIQLHKDELHKGSWHRYVTNYKLRQNKK